MEKTIKIILIVIVIALFSKYLFAFYISSKRVIDTTEDLRVLEELIKSNINCWQYWQNDYYPQVIKNSYPVYIQ